MKSSPNSILIKPIEDLSVVKIAGVEIKIDTSFQPFWYAPQLCEVVGIPDKDYVYVWETETGEQVNVRYPMDFKVGDKVYVHHNAIHSNFEVWTPAGTAWTCTYDMIFARRAGDIIVPCRNFVFLEPMPVKKQTHSILEIVDFSENKNSREYARLLIPNDNCPFELKVGAVYLFKKNRDYSMKIDNRILYRMSFNDLLAEVHDVE